MTRGMADSLARMPIRTPGLVLTEHEKALISPNAAQLVADAMKADEQMMVKHGVATLTARDTRKEPVAKQRELWLQFPLKKATADKDTFAAERVKLEAEAARVHAELTALLPVKDRVDFEPELPRTPTGKLVKRHLRDRYWPSVKKA